MSSVQAAARTSAIDADLRPTDTTPPEGWAAWAEDASPDDLDLESAECVRREPFPTTRRDDDTLPVVNLTCAAEIKIRSIDWLWVGHLPQGKFVVSAGPAGTGKTTVALSLGAIQTRGGLWPDGTRAVPGNVLIWSGEDDPADTIVPRLKAMGADLKRVFIVGMTGQGEDKRAFDPAQDMAALELAVAQIGEIKMVIVDPVVSAVSGDSHKNTEVRRGLQPLVDLATRLHACVYGISHFSKGTAGREPLERVTGSVAFGAIARVVFVSMKGKEGRLFARAKSNIGPDGGGFAYDLDQFMDDGIEVSVVRWGAELEGTARELLEAAEAVADSPRGDAYAWLEDMLAGAEVPVKTIRTESTAAGLSWRTIERAKAELCVVAERISTNNAGGGYWVWSLPGKAAKVQFRKSANLTTDCGGVVEKEHWQGASDGFDSQDRNTANFESDGVAP